MKTKILYFALMLVVAYGASGRPDLQGQATALPPPGFHHLHLSSTNPGKAIDFYVREFPTTSKSTWGGMPALKSPNNVLVLFTEVEQPPSTQPQTAVWHFG